MTDRTETIPELPIEAARVILCLADIAWGESSWPEGTDALLREIARQHPTLVDEFRYLPTWHREPE